MIHSREKSWRNDEKQSDNHQKTGSIHEPGLPRTRLHRTQEFFHYVVGLVCCNDCIAEKRTQTVENLNAVDNVFCWFSKKLFPHSCIGRTACKVVNLGEQITGNCRKNYMTIWSIFLHANSSRNTVPRSQPNLETDMGNTRMPDPFCKEK